LETELRFQNTKGEGWIGNTISKWGKGVMKRSVLKQGEMEMEKGVFFKGE